MIFRYVKPQDQHGKTNLDDLIKYRTQQAEEDIARKKQELRQANAKVVAVEKKLTEDYRKELEEKIRLKKEDIEAHAKARPEEKPNPEASAGTPSAETDAGRRSHAEDRGACGADHATVKPSRSKSAPPSKSSGRSGRPSSARPTPDAGWKPKHRATLAAAGLSFGQIVKLTLDYSPLDAVITQKEERLEEIASPASQPGTIIAAMDGDDEAAAQAARAAATAASLVCQKAALETQKAEIVERLGKPAREYQQYLSDLKLWTDREKELRGDDQNPGAETLKGLEKELENVNTRLPGDVCARPAPSGSGLARRSSARSAD